MSVTTTPRRAGPFIGTGSAYSFPFAFKVFAASDVQVLQTETATGITSTLVLDSAYSVTLNADQDVNPGGSVSLRSVLASGYTLMLVSAVPYTQGADFQNLGGFYPKVLNAALDKLTALVQQVYDAASRAISAPPSFGGTLTLPTPVADRILGWNHTADALTNLDPALLSTLAAYGTVSANTYTGDGSTTSFSLSFNPGSVTNLEVFVAGARLTPTTDYQWTAGTTFTLTTAPGVGAKVFARYARGLALATSDASTANYLGAGTGAVAQSVQAKLRATSLSAADYGADPTGSADSTAALNNALAAAAGKVLIIEPGVYKIGASGLNPISSGTMIWGYGATLRLSAAATNDTLRAVGASSITILGLTVDHNSFVPGALYACVGVQNSNTITVRDCQFLHWYYFGAAFNGCTHITFENNLAKLDTARNSINMGLNISSGLGASAYINIRGNKFINTNVEVDCAWSRISGNLITGWKYGGGITSQQSVYSNNLVIDSNICAVSTGTDTDATNPPGIENWAAYSTITGNMCISCSGSGIDSGGKNCTVTGNLCWNNGTTGGSGITMRYGTSTYNASGSVVTGNSCGDTGGAGGTQSYGYEEQSSSLQFMQVSGNQFRGNKVGPQHVLSSTTHYVGPSVSLQSVYGGATIASGASTSVDITMAGAYMNDFVQVSYDKDLQGLYLSAYVKTNNTVHVAIANATAGSVTLASGTFTLRANKHAFSVDI